MTPAPSIDRPTISDRLTGSDEPVNGSLGGRTTFTPSTAVTVVFTWLDVVVGVSWEATTPVLRIASTGRPAVGSNDGVSMVTWYLMFRAAEPAAMSPRAQ